MEGVMNTFVHIVSGKGSKRRITVRKEIKIEFTYPMRKPETFSFKSKNGFTLREFVQAVRKGYKRIYKDPKKYGIWGHCMADLYLEGLSQKTPGTYALSVGS
jgi:hypothetical protein